MKLLDPREFRQERVEDFMQTEQRVRKLAIEEARLTKKVNSARTSVKKEIEKIDEELRVFSAKILKRKDSLKTEVLSLEIKRREALEPIEQFEKALEQREVALQNSEQVLEDDIKKEKRDVYEREDVLIKRVEAITQKENDLEHRSSDIIKKENTLIVEKKDSKESLKRLNQKWLKFHKEVYELQTDIKKRECQVLNQKNTNEIIRQTLTEREEELKSSKRKLVDERGTIQRAWDELKSKQQHHVRG